MVVTSNQEQGGVLDNTFEKADEVVQVNALGSRAPRRRGPKTAAGRARISQNAITHGISSTRPLLPGESSTAWAENHSAIVEALAPEGPVETALAERVAWAVWRLRRVTAYEQAAIAERQHLDTASACWLPSPHDIDKIVRYEAHLSRQLYLALHELESMRAARRGRPAPLIRVDVHGAAETLAATEAATA
jgi:hypothetical protein